MGKAAGRADQRARGAGFVLGLDVGVASVGWAITQIDRDGNPVDVVALGSHLFEPGTDGSDLDRERGKDTAKNLARRNARQMRRMIWRRARRKRKLLLLLIEHSLMPKPAGTLRTPSEIDVYLKGIDAELRRGLPHGSGHREQQTLFYALRHRAATGDVTPTELGRALYHLAQRRGFLSNRRADAKSKDDEDRSVVKASIGELQAAIDKHDPPLLGSYFASLDPDEQRLRGRWTARSMYLTEFDAIWLRQAARHKLSDAAKAAIRHAIFWQRPLKSAKHLIGRCSLLPDEPRCPIAHRDYQRFRVLQAVNHLAVASANEPTRPLAPDERKALLTALLTEGDRTFAKVRSLLQLKKGTEFNLERGDETRIVGHRTDAKLREVFGPAFDHLSEDDRNRVVEDVRSFRLPEALERRGRKRWGLNAQQAAMFAGVALEEGYAPISLAAIRRLLPEMEKGTPYATARKAMFPESFRSGEPLESLPPVLNQSDAPKNPAVIRAMTEVRKLVNALIGRYGKPEVIRVELARDLKNPPKARDRMSKRNRERQKEREHAKARILKEIPTARPSRDDIDKVLLADECNWTCPYTGRAIEMRSLVGRTPQFDIEHIWPRSRSLDDSWLNKTLCYHEENRARKQGRTPREAYSGATFDAIVDRVRRFRADATMKELKLQRFLATEIAPDFTNRHLSDTRYIARATADYLGLLYGGRADAESAQRVFVTTGGLTAWLRSGWGLNTILGDTGEKNRADHRHHAVDAVVVALSSPRSLQILARAAEAADRAHQPRAFREIDPPWNGFRDRVAEMVETVVVSHRQSRRVSGALHEQTLYSPKIGGEHRVRKELAKLSPSIIRKGDIVDQRALAVIRETLMKKLGKAGESPTPQQIGQVFGDPANLPLVKGADGKMVRLRKVRVRADGSYVRLGKPGSGTERDVSTASNHHTVIVAALDVNGNEKSWTDEPVSMLETYRRVAAKEPVVRREVGDGKRFVMTLAQGEFVEIDDPTDATKPRLICRVQNVTKGANLLQPHENAIPSATFKAENPKFRIGGERLRKLRARKVEVTPLGEVRPAGG